MFGYGNYQKGFAKAPSLYIKHQSFWDGTLALVSAIIIITISIKLITSMMDVNTMNSLNHAQELILFLVGITGIGMVLFHGLIWEVEPRYFLPLIYPILLLITIDSFGNSTFHNITTRMTKKTYVILPLVGIFVIILTGSTNRQKPSAAFGNMEFQARLPVFNTIKLPQKSSFTIPVPQDSNKFKVDIPYSPDISVKLADGSEFIPENGKFAIEKKFKKNQDIKITIKSKKLKYAKFYRQLDFFKPLFHGTTIKINGVKNYLPYELDVYDKKPMDSFSNWYNAERE